MMTFLINTVDLCILVISCLATNIFIHIVFMVIAVSVTCSIFELKYVIMRHSIPQCRLTLGSLVQLRSHCKNLAPVAENLFFNFFFIEDCRV